MTLNVHFGKGGPGGAQCFNDLISMVCSFLGQLKNYIKRIEHFNKVDALILIMQTRHAFDVVFSLT